MSRLEDQLEFLRRRREVAMLTNEMRKAAAYGGLARGLGSAALKFLDALTISPMLYGSRIGMGVGSAAGKLLGAPVRAAARGAAGLTSRAITGLAESAIDNPIPAVMLPMTLGTVGRWATERSSSEFRPRIAPSAFSPRG